jgi:rhamnulokinase
VVAGPVEAASLGNLLVQVRASGEIGSLSEIREVARISSQVTRYEPAKVPV